MAELKTIRLKKLDNLKRFGEVEGRTYYVEENNTLYRDVLSTKMAVAQVYLAPEGISKRDEEKATLTLSNALVISNESVGSERVYKVGIYEENGVYVDLSTGGLIRSASLDGNDLVLTFESGDEVRVPLNRLLEGVVKSVNGQKPDKNGNVTLKYSQITGLQDIIDNETVLLNEEGKLKVSEKIIIDGGAL